MHLRIILIALFCIVQTVYGQGLVKKALNISLEEDRILQLLEDEYVDILVAEKAITSEDTAALYALGAFINDPWSIDTAKIHLLRPEVVFKILSARYDYLERLDRDGVELDAAIVASLSKKPEARTRSLGQAVASASEVVAPQATLSTKIIDGTAQFLAMRFKEELTLAFFENFRRKVSDSRELRTLLPNTSDLLLYQDIGAFLSIGPTAKSAFKNDIENMLMSFDRLVNEDSSYQDLANDMSYRSFMLVSKSIDLSRRGYSVPDVMRQLYFQESRQADKLGVAIRLAYIFIDALTETDEKGQKLSFINLAEYQLLDSPKRREYFTALIFQEDRSLKDHLINSHTSFNKDFSKINNLLQEFIILVQNADDERKRLSMGDQNQKVTNDVIFSYISYVLDAIDLSSRLAYFKDPKEYWDTEFYQFGLPLGRKVIQAAKAVNGNDYGTALMASVQVLGDILLLNKNRVNASKITQLRQDLFLYGNFMVNVIHAETAEDVREAIEAVALPVGSARIKKNTLASISINAYPGLYAGVEQINNPQTSNPSSAMSFGFTAPIGLAFNWGLRRTASSYEIERARSGLADLRKRDLSGYKLMKDDTTSRALTNTVDSILTNRKTFRKGGRGKWQTMTESSLSLFLSIVDIGAVVSYRLSSDQTEGLPDNITLRQVFAPGAFVVYGFRRAPISIMAGSQYTPELRSVETNQIQTKYNALRVSLTLAVDIPFFNLYSRPVPY